MPDRTPTGDLRERLAEALAPLWPTQLGRNVEYHRAQVLAAADAVLPVVEAETARAEQRYKGLAEGLQIELRAAIKAQGEAERQRDEALREAKHEKAAHRMASQHAYDADAREAEADAEAARTEARYATERAARLREAGGGVEVLPAYRHTLHTPGDPEHP